MSATYNGQVFYLPRVANKKSNAMGFQVTYSFTQRIEPNVGRKYDSTQFGYLSACLSTLLVDPGIHVGTQLVDSGIHVGACLVDPGVGGEYDSTQFGYLSTCLSTLLVDLRSE